jgi:hypothetical protein
MVHRNTEAKIPGLLFPLVLVLSLAISYALFMLDWIPASTIWKLALCYALRGERSGVLLLCGVTLQCYNCVTL